MLPKNVTKLLLAVCVFPLSQVRQVASSLVDAQLASALRALAQVNSKGCAVGTVMPQV